MSSGPRVALNPVSHRHGPCGYRDEGFPPGTFPGSFLPLGRLFAAFDRSASTGRLFFPPPVKETEAFQDN